MSDVFKLSAPDNDAYMLRGDAPHPACEECGMCTDRSWIDPGFKHKLPTLDASYTYDGYLIVSDRLKRVVNDPTVSFVELPSLPGFHVLRPAHVLQFDYEARGTRFLKFCTTCTRYTQVAGATPVILKPSSVLTQGLARTDIEFGSGDEQHPLVLVSAPQAARFKVEKLSGLTLKPVSCASAP